MFYRDKLLIDSQRGNYCDCGVNEFGISVFGVDVAASRGSLVPSTKDPRRSTATMCLTEALRVNKPQTRIPLQGNEHTTTHIKD